MTGSWKLAPDIGASRLEATAGVELDRRRVSGKNVPNFD